MNVIGKNDFVYIINNIEPNTIKTITDSEIDIFQFKINYR